MSADPEERLLAPHGRRLWACGGSGYLASSITSLEGACVRVCRLRGGLLGGMPKGDRERQVDREQLQLGEGRPQGPPPVGGGDPDVTRADSHPTRSARYSARCGAKSRPWPTP